MNKNLRLIIALSVVMVATSACKTKQKIVEIPAGAKIQAVAPKTAATQQKTTEPAVKQAVSNEKEVTRNENFSLAEGESNTDALKLKYHVVVGSFSKKENAKGLQSTLNAEGNKAIVVVNEQAMFRVLIASFNDYNQAHARIKEIETRFPGSWVLVKK
ncbi:MAG: SPOR domain-containing protein [Paludibacter sp.]